MCYQIGGHKLYVVSRRGHQLYGGTVDVTPNNPTVPTYIHANSFHKSLKANGLRI
jgi:hypothetical protein